MYHFRAGAQQNQNSPHQNKDLSIFWSKFKAIRNSGSGISLWTLLQKKKKLPMQFQAHLLLEG